MVLDLWDFFKEWVKFDFPWKETVNLCVQVDKDRWVTGSGSHSHLSHRGSQSPEILYHKAEPSQSQTKLFLPSLTSDSCSFSDTRWVETRHRNEADKNLKDQEHSYSLVESHPYVLFTFLAGSFSQSASTSTLSSQGLHTSPSFPWFSALHYPHNCSLTTAAS